MSRYSFWILMIAILFAVMPNIRTAYAQTYLKSSQNLNAQTPVLHDGRVKPLDSFARFILKTIHGQDHLKSQTAAQWLIETQTNPNTALKKPIFKIRNKTVKQRLKIHSDQNYASAEQLAQGFAPITQDIENLIMQEDSQALSHTEQDLITLYDKTLTFAALLSPNGIPLTSAQSDIHPTQLKWEHRYNRLKPFKIASYLYALAGIIALIFINLNTPTIAKQKQNIMICFGVFSLAIMIHALAITMRIYILSRPPVGTLYESVLFVSFICALFGLIMTFIKSKPSEIQNGLIIISMSALTSAALIMIAPFTLNGTDELGTLGAVLNTNFWLGTHVICITTGYAACIICALMAHASLFKPSLNLQKTTYVTSMIALFLTATGTALGGIWADQSWGRFWGWDPKENGALLIVLWLTWLHHGKLSNKLNQTMFDAGIAGLNIIVALAWFGVNLLGIGLHAYGFTTGLVSGLIIFMSLQLITITALTARAKKSEKT